MSEFLCRVSDPSGRVSKIHLYASSEEDISNIVRDKGAFLISYVEVKWRKKRQYSQRIIQDYTDTIALMLQSGLTLKDALNVSISSMSGKKGKALVLQIIDRLDKGTSYPDILDIMSGDFSSLYRGLVRIGDSTGSLDEIYGRLSQYMHDERILRDKIRNALIYPLMVVSILVMTILGVFLFIIPRIKHSLTDQSFQQIYERFELMVNICTLPLIMILVLSIFILLSSRSNGELKKWTDWIVLKSPVIGKVSLMKSALNMTFSMEILTSSGFPIESAIHECSNVLSNLILKSAMLRIEKNITKGEKLSKAFQQESSWPGRIALWIAVGEASGNICAVFKQLRSYFQEELEKTTSRIILLIEPALIVFVGVIMLLFVFFFLIPLFNLFGGIL